MPAYVSHTIMARDVYDRIDNKNVNLDYMLTFSLGGDLARFSKCKRTSHKIKTEEFIDNIFDGPEEFVIKYNGNNYSVKINREISVSDDETEATVKIIATDVFNELTTKEQLEKIVLGKNYLKEFL